MTWRGPIEAMRVATHRSVRDGGGLVVSIAFYVVIVGTLSGLWRVAVHANGGDLAGYGAVALTWYIITSEAAIVAVNAKHIEDIGTDITANLLAQHAVAASAFWLRDAGSIWFLYMKAVFILGGMIIPLELLPDGLQRGALLLPFRAMAYDPARLASGHWEPVLLLEQVAWIGVLAVVAVAAFGAGERRLQVVGG